MITLLLMISLSIHPQDIEAAKITDAKLYPVDRKIILLIEEEARRLRGLINLRKRRASMPACPIEPNYWYNLDCA
jgi:hypothetical protein